MRSTSTTAGLNQVTWCERVGARGIPAVGSPRTKDREGWASIMPGGQSRLDGPRRAADCLKNLNEAGPVWGNTLYRATIN